MFKPVSSHLNITLLEEEVLRFWKLHRIFEKTDQQRPGKPEYIFYEGPPTANGKPGVHHVLARAHKDILLRYKTMRGYHVTRRGGWDTHGLPVELEVERQLGLTSKSQIEQYGIERFNALCRISAFDYIQDWEKLTERIGYWVDLDNAYVTFSQEYIESVWWIFKKLWEKGLIYQSYKVVPYCPRCGTPLSDHEVALGYDQVEDPSIFVRLPLVEDPGTSLLVWTTTPWSLTGNVAVAAHPEADYVIVEHDLPEDSSEKLILAKPLVEKVFRDETVRVYETFKGKKLKGLRYHPLFTFLLPDKPANYVLPEDFVTTEEGTGLVHIAPAFGAEDMRTALEFNLPILMTVNEEGNFVDQVRPWRGMFVKEADPYIIQNLERRGLLFRAETCFHTYPFCWSCRTPLLYYARNTWYLHTAQYKEKLIELNQRIHWHPEPIRSGRFGNWLENNVDWALGRERYWGTPLPIWECASCHHQACIGSIDELSQNARRDLSDLDPHRPYVDGIKFTCPECSGVMRRVPEVIDVWFDSGAMPVAQWHYPFENQETFQQQFPADFICEAIDQTRGWFYSLHAISTLLFESECYRNVICLGLLLDDQGQKMSTSRGNAADPWQVIHQYGADAFRWHLYTDNQPGQDRRFSKDQIEEVIKDLTLPIWNVYASFVTYANLDGWTPASSERGRSSYNYSDLDRWLLSELQVVTQEVTQAFEAYDIPGTTRPIQQFVDLLSKWYLRRTKRRIWKDGADADKRASFATLYETLVTLSKLLAPAMPFLAEEIYQNLVIFGGGADERAEIPAESVHLTPWAEVDPARIDEALNHHMELIMKLASLGHSARNQAGIKLRQPLAQASFFVSNAEEAQVLAKYADLLADELNVKQVNLLGSTGEVVRYSLKPLPRQLGQKYKADFPKISQAIEALDTEPTARSLLGGLPVSVVVDGNPIEVLPEEVEVQVEARSGWAVSTEGLYLAALSTALTSELIQEDLAREFVRRVQDYRKQAGYEITDRIRLYVLATPRLAQAIQTHYQYIAREIQAIELIFDQTPENAVIQQIEFEQESVSFSAIKTA